MEVVTVTKPLTEQVRDRIAASAVAAAKVRQAARDAAEQATAERAPAGPSAPETGPGS